MSTRVVSRLWLVSMGCIGVVRLAHAADCSNVSDLAVNHGLLLCNGACVYTGAGQWLCDVKNVDPTVAWEAYMVTDPSRNLCGFDYCSWGTELGGGDFCCGMNDVAGLVNATLEGSANADALSLAYYDSHLPANLDLSDMGGGGTTGEARGMDGADFIMGSRSGAGAYLDLLSGGVGNDEIHGQAGNDRILGNENDDLVYGGTGNDVISGNAGDDDIYCEDGADQVNAGTGYDYVEGGNQNDTICGGADDDILNGDGGDDYLWDLQATDTLDGNAGADTCGDNTVVVGLTSCTGTAVAPVCPPG